MMVPSGKNILLNISLSLLSVAVSFTLGYFLYGSIVKKPMRDIPTLQTYEYALFILQPEGAKTQQIRWNS